MNYVQTSLMLMICLMFSTPALAYLDPVSGSLFFQLILGGVAGASLAIKLYWRRILSFFGRHARNHDRAQN